MKMLGLMAPFELYIHLVLKDRME